MEAMEELNILQYELLQISNEGRKYLQLWSKNWELHLVSANQ